MAARLAALSVALVIGVMPIAQEVCELLCAASMPAHHMAAHNPHAACGATLSTQPACCGDADRTPTAPPAPAKLAIDPPMLIARLVSMNAVPVIAVAIPERVTLSRAPVPLSRRTPLRL
jgi:hypothetical protein